jgi:hypothetical protein
MCKSSSSQLIAIPFTNLILRTGQAKAFVPLIIGVNKLAYPEIKKLDVALQIFYSMSAILVNNKAGILADRKEFTKNESNKYC